MGSLLTYIARRILFMVPVFLAVSILTFVMTNAAGNPIDLIRIGIKNLTTAQLKSLQDYYHVNDPIFVRYFYWLADFVQGNLGTSLLGGSVAQKVVPWIATTLELQLTSLFLALGIGVPIGVFSAKHQYSKSDVTVTTTAIFGVSMPTFWLGIMGVLVFSFYIHWLPASGAVSGYPPYWWGSIYSDLLAHALLPIAVLTFVSLATVVRLVRANMLEVNRQDYILAAKASGLKSRTITYKYALKNAITPLITIVGLSFGLSLGGAPALETTFSWPGLGYAFVNAATVLDLPVVQGITMIITLIVLIANLGTDLFYAYLDPRVRLS
ncbi:MAG: ABC transporter permease [Nitrososphaerales archaeon]|nr:ABC transporter permease [Nitrososphaerales archaeon]